MHIIAYTMTLRVMVKPKIFRDAILEGLGLLPKNNLKILDALSYILDTSEMDFYILFYDSSLHYLLLQIIGKINIILLC